MRRFFILFAHFSIWIFLLAKIFCKLITQSELFGNISLSNIFGSVFSRNWARMELWEIPMTLKKFVYTHIRTKNRLLTWSDRRDKSISPNRTTSWPINWAIVWFIGFSISRPLVGRVFWYLCQHIRMTNRFSGPCPTYYSHYWWTFWPIEIIW